MNEGPSKLAVAQKKARRKRLVLYTMAVVLLIPVIAINVVNRIETPVPAPLWTRDALPTPAEADNGWPLIAHYHSTTISGIDLQPIDNLLSAARGGAQLVELGPVFSPARVVASKITQHTKICNDAFEKKRMVNPCLAIDKDACTAEPLAICSRIVSFAALDAVSRGLPSGAGQLANVLRQLADAAANSPHPWIQARVLLLLRNAIHDAGAAIKWRRASPRAVREALQAIDGESLPLDHLVIASYLLKHLALQQAIDGADTWLLDEGDTMRGLDAPFAVAKDGGDLPPPPDYTAGAFWWFDNPIGKKMLEAVQPGADDDFARTKELRASVLTRRDEALKLGLPR